MGNIKRGKLERIGAILSNRGAFWLAMSLVTLFNSLNTGPVEYAMPLTLLTACAILGVVVMSQLRPAWTAFQQGNKIWLLVGVVVVANFAVLLPYHPDVWSALKYQAFMVVLFCFCVMYEFFKTKADVVDDPKDEDTKMGVVDDPTDEEANLIK